MGKRMPDITLGTVIGKWTVIAEAHKIKDKAYLCECVCGNQRVVTKSNLLLGKSTSCNKGKCRTITVTHGLTKHPLYSVWAAIKYRIKNPTGKNECYSGLAIAPEWTSFDVFYNWAIQNGYQKGLTIDRIDTSVGYFPKNCRWVDTVVQSQNRRVTKRKTSCTFKGVYLSKPRNNDRKYKGTGLAPWYFIVIYKGVRHQQWGFTSAEEAYRARCDFIESNYKGLVYAG